jgi:uncharacterized protein YrrD
VARTDGAGDRLMLRSVKTFLGYRIQARDHEFGRAEDLLFDDQEWVVRYLVIDTGTWLPHRKVLIPPTELGEPDWDKEVFPVDLTKKQVEDSPSIDRDKPLWRQKEAELLDYFGWKPYWLGAAPPRSSLQPGYHRVGGDDLPPESREEQARGNPHLRSMEEINGYHVRALDREIGHVDDFIVDDESWRLRFLVADTGIWLQGRKVLIGTERVTKVDWEKSYVAVDLTSEKVKDSPPYDPTKPVNREHEEVLYDFYGRPVTRHR